MFKKVFDYIKLLKNIEYTNFFKYISVKESIIGLVYFSIYKLIYNVLCFSKYYKNTNDEICQTDNLEKKIDISFNKNLIYQDTLDNFLYDISLDNISLDDILEIEDKNKKNICYIDKSIQCELNIEEMINISDLEINYSLPDDTFNTSSRFRWFFR